MKKIFLIVILLLLTTGCKKNIVGKWKAIDTNNEYNYIFNEDNTCSYEMTVARLDCTYEQDNTKLKISYNGNKEPYTYDYYFEKETLIIKDITGKYNKFVKEK